VDRRTFLMLTSTVIGSSAMAELNQIRERPDPKTFEAGDFLWPKAPGVFIPYSGVSASRSLTLAQELSEEEWTAQKIDFIRSVRSAQSQDPAKKAYLEQIATDMENLSYSAFYNSYAAGVTPTDFQTYGAGQILYVGHVAIVDFDSNGKPVVIEAVYGEAPRGTSIVERLPYDEWIEVRKSPLVWQGRLKVFDATKRADIAHVANEQLMKPYRFFNFDLSDESGFYCSKLVWYATMKAIGVALDGDPNPRRRIWFSPLQAMKQRDRIEILSSAGNYRNA
jgi:uncharacterized protein YycO